MSAPAPAPARSGRALAMAAGGLALAALLLWGATQLVWYRVTPEGHTPVEFDGSRAAPAMAGVALVALATVAALVAMSGIARRLLGVLLAIVGVLEGIEAVRAWANPPFAGAGPLPVPPSGVVAASLRHQPTEVTAAPLLAVAGGLVMLLVGLYLLVREARLPRFGSRYASAAKRPAEIDPDRAAWQDLDAGRDPTADPAGARGDDPGSGSRIGPD